MNDFMNKVSELVRIWNESANVGIDITEKVADKIRNLSLKLLASDTFMVDTHYGPKEMARLNVQEIEFIHAGHKFDALKSYRNRIGQSLIESKNAVDQHCRNNGIK